MRQLIEYREINQLERAILTRCRDAVTDIDPSAEVILYGSRARGDAEPESDYDLLILIDGEATLDREDIFRRQIYLIELETGSVFTILLASRKDWSSPLCDAMPLYQNIKKEGVVL